jgi:hypothetical protein
MKASGGCENLKTQVVGAAKPTKVSRCPVQRNAVGFETSRETLLVGVQDNLYTGFLGNWKSNGGSWVLGYPLKRN